MEPKAIQNAEAISLKIPYAGATKIQFTENSNLRGKKVYAVEVVPNISTSMKDPNGDACVSINETLDSFITLCDEKGKRETIKSMPLGVLMPYYNVGQLKIFEPRVIDLQKSYIVYGGAGTLTAGEVYLIVFYFMDE